MTQFTGLPRWFVACNTALMSYDTVHRLARERLRHACQRCRSTVRLQAALNPSAPVSNLRLDAQRNCWYRMDAGDYMTLCSRCHFRMDYRLRTSCVRLRRVRRNAPCCNVCGEPAQRQQYQDHASCRLRTSEYAGE
jgi:hypothetical protein